MGTARYVWIGLKSAAKHDRLSIYRVTHVQGFTAYKLGPEQGDYSGTLLFRISAVLRTILFETLDGFIYWFQVNTGHYLKISHNIHILSSFLNNHAGIVK